MTRDQREKNNLPRPAPIQRSKSSHKMCLPPEMPTPIITNELLEQLFADANMDDISVSSGSSASSTLTPELILLPPHHIPPERVMFETVPRPFNWAIMEEEPAEETEDETEQGVDESMEEQGAEVGRILHNGEPLTLEQEQMVSRNAGFVVIRNLQASLRFMRVDIQRIETHRNGISGVTSTTVSMRTRVEYMEQQLEAFEDVLLRTRVYREGHNN